MSKSSIKITISESGSYRVEGEPILYDHQGDRLKTPDGKPFFLCRCGQSSRKPFCDSSHKTADWDPTLGGETS